MPVEAGSADGHRSGAIKLPVCGIRDSSQIHRMVVDAVVVIKKLFPTYRIYFGGSPPISVRLGCVWVRRLFDSAISNNKEKSRAKLRCLKDTLNILPLFVGLKDDCPPFDNEIFNGESIMPIRAPRQGCYSPNQTKSIFALRCT